MRGSDHADTFSAVYGVSFRSSDSKIYPIFRQGASGRDLRNAGRVLSAQCVADAVQLRSAGADRDRGNDRIASLETPDAGIDRRRNRLLYAACAICFLILIQNHNKKVALFPVVWRRYGLFFLPFQKSVLNV